MHTKLERNAYQADGRLISKRQVNGNEVQFAYDVFGNEREITTTRSWEKGVAAQRYHYDTNMTSVETDYSTRRLTVKNATSIIIETS